MTPNSLAPIPMTCAPHLMPNVPLTDPAPVTPDLQLRRYRDERLSMKVSKMITAVGTEQLDLLGMNRTTYREQTYLSLKVGRVYVLDPDKKFVPRAMGQPVQVAPATASAERK